MTQMQLNYALYVDGESHCGSQTYLLAGLQAIWGSRFRPRHLIDPLYDGGRHDQRVNQFFLHFSMTQNRARISVNSVLSVCKSQ
jgi:hypothetical protein